MRIKIVLLTLVGIFLWSCVPTIEQEVETNSSTTAISGIKNLNIPSHFNFKTTTTISLDITVKSLKNKPLSGVRVSFYSDHPDFDGRYLASGFTNQSGVLDTEILVPTYMENIFVLVHSFGFANQIEVPISPAISLDFGGIPPDRKLATKRKTTTDRIHIGGNYYYVGDFTTGSMSSGLPSYLEPQGDELTQSFLNDVYESLPERKRVPFFNPEYLASGNQLDVVVNETSEVWLTFVTEGAGYRNSLGYYVFDTDTPPTTASDIDSVFVILPNASLNGSGGALNAGDKIKLGTFSAGKTISWVLFQNAWTGNGVNINNPKFYSRTDLNTIESNPDMRQHTVQLSDIGRQILLNGFEDLTRSTYRSDDDFNDLIFYVSANPWEAIDIGSMPPVTPSPTSDTDGDGVSNESDDFPNDPTRAVRNTYTGSLAYEDLWPAQGDYDFNDIVIDYEIDHILNGSNQLVEIEADWTIMAVFASYKNGFGVKLNSLPSNSVASVSGLNLKENIITQNGNGTEANQDNATVIFFDNIFNVVQEAGSPYPYTDGVTFSSVISFTTPVNESQVGFPPYHAFIFADGDRGKEIHLPGNEPTDLANTQLFGTSFDATNFASEYYYKTSNGLPWAINLSESFDFPKEGTPIDEAYLHFSIWATSGGISNKDWYLNIPSNRNSSKIYSP